MDDHVAKARGTEEHHQKTKEKKYIRNVFRKKQQQYLNQNVSDFV